MNPLDYAGCSVRDNTMYRCWRSELMLQQKDRPDVTQYVWFKIILPGGGGSGGNWWPIIGIFHSLGIHKIQKDHVNNCTDRDESQIRGNSLSLLTINYK